MLIGITGNFCSGVEAVTDYLVRNRGFVELQCMEARGSDPRQHAVLNGEVLGEESILDKLIINDEDTSAKKMFTTIAEFLSYVTSNWKDNFVISGIYNPDVLRSLSKRPFFLQVAVDAPITQRYQRYLTSTKSQTLSLEEFARASDEVMYDPQTGIAPLILQAKVHVFNVADGGPLLDGYLDKINLTNPLRLRPSWDLYFMELADLAARRSNCMKRRVGSVLVREKRVISTGYNGTPRGMTNCNDGGCERCNSAQASGIGLGTCLCLHAEENALLEAGKERIGKDSTLYCNTCPCLTCSIKIVQVGISEVVYTLEYSMDDRSKQVLSEGGVHLRQFHGPDEVSLVI